MRARQLVVLGPLLLCLGCGAPSDPTRSASTGPIVADAGVPSAAAVPPPPAETPVAADPAAARLPLSDRLDCVRKAAGILVSGHRGGPTRDYPENAIETFDRAFKAGVRIMETDAQATRDGKLVLMHDDTLDRTTTGSGEVAGLTVAQIQALKLKTYSQETNFHPPTLEAALAWAVQTGAILKIDKKRDAGYPPIIAAIRAAHAENNAMIITYTDDQAVEVARAAPELTVIATLDSAGRLDDLLKRGVKAEKLLAWTSTERPNPELWRALAARGVESSFGTLGPRGSSLDSRYWEDGDGEEYNALAQGGLVVVDTDLTDKVTRQLSPERRKAVACGF